MGRRYFLALMMVASVGCGGGGSSDNAGAGTLGFRVLWEGRDVVEAEPRRASAFAATIPNAVNTVRILLTPSGAPASAGCCVAVRRGTQTFAERLLVLDGISPGDYVVDLAGYASDFAPADGAGSRCATSPSSAASPCDTARRASPSFGSDGVTVSVLAEERTDAGDIVLYSLPFPVSLQPAEGDLAAGPNVGFDAVLADAVNDIVAGSVAVRMGAAGSALAVSSLDPLVACDDLAGGGVPTCSEDGSLQVRGYRVTGTSVVIADGPATLNVVAANDGTPSRQLDWSYDFTVGSATSTSSSTTTTTTTTLSSGSTTTTTVTSGSTTTTAPVGSTTSTTLASQRACTVVFGTDDTVDLSGISFEVDYSAAPGDFVGSGATVQCALASGIGATAAFNDQDSARTLIAALVTSGAISAPTDLVECDYLGVLPPIDADFVVSVREAFDETLALVPVTVTVTSIACAP